MRYRPLGQTGLTVSEIGFGAWGIGGTANGAVAYGPTDDAVSKASLRRAYELGITFYDTSGFYGFGHSERLIGEEFADVRKNVIIATKAGMLDANGAQDFSPAHIRRSLEASLSRLQTDYVDLFLLHSPAKEVITQDNSMMSLMQTLQTEGKIRSFGVSVRSPDDALVAVGECGFKVIEVNFNLVDQRARQNKLFDLCREKGAGVIIRTPLCFGFLSGQYTNTQFAPGDHRGRWSVEQREKWSNSYKVFSSALMKTEAQTDAQIALRFCLSYPDVSTVIPGMLTSQQVEENVIASQLDPLAEADRLKVEEIYEDNNFMVERKPLK